MKKILFISGSMNMGGVEKSLLRLLKAIDKTKYAVTLMLIKKSGILADEIPSDICVYEMPFTDETARDQALNPLYKQSLIEYLRYAVDFKFFNRKQHVEPSWIQSLLREACSFDETFDLAIDFHGYGHFGIPYLFEKVSAKKKAVFIHDENISGFYGVYQYIKKADCFFAVSDACKKVFTDEYPEFADKTVKFENIFDTQDIRSKAMEKASIQFKIENQSVVFVSVGRLETQKGFDRGVAVFRRLKVEGYQFRWYVIGDGSQRKNLEQMVSDGALENDIFLLGNQKNPYPIVGQADMFLQISRHEGKPLAVFEAQSLGVPVFATRYSAVEEQVCHGIDGYIAENNDEAIYKGIKWILENRTEIKRYKENLKSFSISNEDSLKKIYRLL